MANESHEMAMAPGNQAPFSCFYSSSSSSKCINILAISGSVRKESSNTALLQAAKLLAPSHVKIYVYEHLKSMPIFDADEADQIPAHPFVADFRDKLKAADGVIISSPEYVHGIPGGLKNAIDWVVDSCEFCEKPTILLNARQRSVHAPLALLEVVKTVGGKVLGDTVIQVPLNTHRTDAQSILAKEKQVCEVLKSAIKKLCDAITQTLEVKPEQNVLMENTEKLEQEYSNLYSQTQ